jgi:AcrR family transcriptional regulator
VNESINTLRSRQKLQTRSEIVRVAFDLFGQLGFEKVSVEAIAAAVGISRATFFNYFPQKELLLREIASARMEKLKRNLAVFGPSDAAPTFEQILEMVLALAEENARISQQSKKLLLEAIFHQASQGLMLAAREQAIQALTEVIARIPRRHPNDPRAVAETFFSVYIGTMLEWLMREDVPQEWLRKTMRERLLLVLEGVA